MFDFYQKRKIRAIVNSRYTQAFLLLLIVFVGWSAYVRFDIATQMSQRREVAQQSTAALQERKDVLENEVLYLSDERGIEAEMRRQFDVALEGEQVVVIVEEGLEEIVKPLGTSTPEFSVRWYQFWR